MSSPSSKKSATRPAFSSDWFSDSPSPSTFTSVQNSCAQLGDLLPRLGQALGGAGHAAVVPHRVAELAVEVVDRVVALDAEELAQPLLDGCFGFLERRALAGSGTGLPSCAARSPAMVAGRTK